MTVTSITLDPARLSTLGPLAGCSAKVLAGLSGIRATAGHELVAEGTTSDYAYVIVSGTASVTRRGHDVATLGSGDVFGESAVVGSPRTATVTAVTDMELAQLDPATLSEATGTELVAWHLLRAMIQRAGGTAPLPAPDETDFGGEALNVPERVVVAPTAGVFHPKAPEVVTTEGEIVNAGQVLGTVHTLDRDEPVKSPFAGLLMGMLALDGERVRPGQAIAWLRTF